jgi:predicted Zn-dependent protease
MAALASSISRRTATAAALALALALPSCATNPATGRRQIALVSEAQEKQMGQQADQEVAASIGLYPESSLQSYVQRIGDALAAKSERPALNWTFRLVDDPAVNAFALPGGYVYVTRGLMSHLTSEAELAAVIGHEIGHITARHTVSMISKAQLANVGLMLGMILRPELQNYGNLAEAGLSVLFLKYSRDAERQADDLGLRYVSRSDYDPRPMADVFTTLERVSALEKKGRVPGWLATHPDPGDRRARIGREIAALGTAPGSLGRDRAEYLHRLEGMEFGEDPREGFFQGETFYHPEMRFQMSFPAGWKTSNQKQAVGATSPNQDAIVVVTLAQRESPEIASREFFSQGGVQRGNAWQGDIHGLPAVAHAFAAQTQQGILRGIAAFVGHQGKVFQILGYTPSSRWPRYDDVMAEALNSFRRLTDRRYLDVQPKRLAIVNVPRAMSLRDFADRYPSTVPLETLAIINETTVDGMVEPGPAKRVVGGELPDEEFGSPRRPRSQER